MIASRRLAIGSSRYTSSSSVCSSAANTVIRRQILPHRRIYLTKANPPSRAPRHVRSYKTTLKNPYFSNVNAELIQEELLEPSVSWFQRIFKWYSKKLSTHPLLTKSLTGAIVAMAGDVLCQAGTYNPKGVTNKRVNGNPFGYPGKEVGTINVPRTFFSWA